MANNVLMNAGSGGETAASDDCGGLQYQRIKLTDGTEDSTTPVNVGSGVKANALRVTLATDQVQLTNALLVDGSAVTQPVSGTFYQATQPVSAAALPLPTGASTAAKQPALGTAGTASTDVISVQGIASMTPLQATVTNATAANLKAEVTVAAAQTIAVTNAGTFAVQNTAQASTNTQEMVGDAAHDAAAAGNPVLVGAYASAAAPTDVSADADAVRIWALRNGSPVVNIAAGGALIGATSNALDVNIKSGAGSGGTAMADDAAFTAATTSVTPIGAFFDDTGTDSVDENDIGAVRMSGNRNLYVRLRDNAGNERGLNIDANGALAATVTNGTAANLKAEVVGTGTFVVQNTAQASTNTQEVVGDVAHDAAIAGNPLTVGAVASAAAPTDVSADQDAVRLWALRSGALAVQPTMGGVLAVAGNGASGTGVQRVTIANDSTGQVAITGTVTVASHAVTNAGTFAVQAASAGDVAHDGADSGNPVKVGGKATNVEPAAVSATGDRANFITDMVGKLINLPYSNPENFVSGAITSAMTGTTSTSLVAAPASGLRNYLTTIIVSNAHATVGTDIVIQDGSGGTTLMTIPAAAVYGGAVITLPVPLRQPTTATAIYCANVTTGASTKVSAVGYKGI